jgi:hypothetical protein
MTATIRTRKDEVFEYLEAHEIKEADGKYVVYDKFSSVLGVYLCEDVVEISTVPPTVHHALDQNI